MNVWGRNDPFRSWFKSHMAGHGRSVDFGLVARAVLDALRVKVLLDVFGDPTLHGDRVHPTHVFI